MPPQDKRHGILFLLHPNAWSAQKVAVVSVMLVTDGTTSHKPAPSVCARETEAASCDTAQPKVPPPAETIGATAVARIERSGVVEPFVLRVMKPIPNST